MIDSGSINLEDLASSIGIDRETVIELLGIYSCEMSEEMQQVILFLRTQDWSSLQRAMHNIKGVSANLYLEDMSKVAEELDIKLKQSDYEGIENSIHNLLDTFDETLKSIHKVSAQEKK